MPKVDAAGGVAGGGEGSWGQPATIWPGLFPAGTGGGEAVTAVGPTGPSSISPLGHCSVPPCGQEGAALGLGQASSKAKAKATISLAFRCWESDRGHWEPQVSRKGWYGPPKLRAGGGGWSCATPQQCLQGLGCWPGGHPVPCRCHRGVPCVARARWEPGGPGESHCVGSLCQARCPKPAWMCVAGQGCAGVGTCRSVPPDPLFLPAMGLEACRGPPSPRGPTELVTGLMLAHDGAGGEHACPVPWHWGCLLLGSSPAVTQSRDKGGGCFLEKILLSVAIY